MRIDTGLNEVVIGPWQGYNGDFTWFDVKDLREFISKLESLVTSTDW